MIVPANVLDIWQMNKKVKTLLKILETWYCTVVVTNDRNLWICHFIVTNVKDEHGFFFQFCVTLCGQIKCPLSNDVPNFCTDLKTYLPIMVKFLDNYCNFSVQSISFNYNFTLTL
jgi:hypothetical protein